MSPKKQVRTFKPVDPMKRFLSPKERAARLAKIMRVKDMGPYQVARRAQESGLNLSPIQVYRVMGKGRVSTPDPRVSTLVALAVGCGVSAGFFIDRKVV